MQHCVKTCISAYLAAAIRLGAVLVSRSSAQNRPIRAVRGHAIPAGHLWHRAAAAQAEIEGRVSINIACGAPWLTTCI